MDITKATGETEEFDERKLRESMENAGVPVALMDKVMRKAGKHLQRVPHSDHLFNKVRGEIASQDPIAAMRYGLKRSLMRMGPSGHPFEYYFAKVLQAHGYDTQVGMIVDGHCVPHEIDVIATKGDERVMVESKFHSRSGIRSRLKDSLYIHSRYLDVKDEHAEGSCFMVDPTSADDLANSTTHTIRHERGYGGPAKMAARGFTDGMLVTNTKVTRDGVMYAACSGLQIVSWKYPKEGSLEQLIEAHRTYPVAVFSQLSNKRLNLMFEHGVHTIQDLIGAAPNKLSQGLRISRRQASSLQDAAKALAEA